MGSVSLKEVISCKIVGNKGIEVRTRWRDFTLIADDISVAVDWAEAIELNVKNVKANQEDFGSLKKKYNSEMTKLQKSNESMSIELAQIKGAYEEQSNIIKEMQILQHKRDEQISALREELEKLESDRAKMLSLIAERDSTINDLKTDLVYVSDKVFSDAINEASADRRSDKETVERVKERWKTDRKMLEKAQQEHEATFNELADTSMSLHLVNRKMVMLDKKMMDFTRIFLEFSLD